MRAVFFLLPVLLSLPLATSYAQLRHWQSEQHSVPLDTALSPTPKPADKPWKLCALYPSLKDSYWLSVNFGMLEAARRYAVALKIMEASGYNQLHTQQEQIAQCRQWGADALIVGSSTAQLPQLKTWAGPLPVIELVNATHNPHIATRVGVPWYQMGYLPGHYLARQAKGKPMNVLLMPGPRDAGGSNEMLTGFKQALAGSQLHIVDIAYGDNDTEVQRNLLQDMLERYPNIDIVAGTAIAAEVAMGENLRRAKPLEIVSFYLSHQVYRGLKRDKIAVSASDQMVWQGELAVEQAVRVLQHLPVSNNISPPLLLLTPHNIHHNEITHSLSPLGFRPVYSYQP
ncbi:TMAO reductase system periplasmic protein TorT [Plesiomonas shigelloides]|uniref:TMAO reductase system periplasmic protein TorT n=1 Tax=Plesiomonas shigelloides TaxID=703 RepID=UPI0012620F59|nr:TMAO reductase system periplasmic protein TorT [Plesiomonas shigelloides]KAB7700800.1 TMAO reductase system periplasmic protein TorT [Plesiomonas shigelloides]